jgi:hypothetical protein
MFKQIRGSRDEIVTEMLKEVERVYGRLLTRIIRQPRSARNAAYLPRWIVCPDVPVPKYKKQSRRDVTLNDGWHVHAVALLPNESRLRTSLDCHLREDQRLYIRPERPLRHVRADLITERADYVTDYALKSYKRGRTTGDEILLLPRAARELVPN